MADKKPKTLEVLSRGQWRNWLQKHHALEAEIWLVFHKRHTGEKSNLRPRRPPRKSPSLDKNGQLILAPFEQEMMDEVRREHPDWAKEFITDYIKERIKVAKRVFNDPVEIEKSIDLLEAALKRKR